MKNFIVIFLCVGFMVIGFFECSIKVNRTSSLELKKYNHCNHRIDTIYIEIDKEDIVIIDTLPYE